MRDDGLANEFFVESYEEYKTIFPTDILYFFISRLDSYDRYFFIFALTFEKTVRRGISLNDLKIIEKFLPYKSRIYQKAFIRLEAIDFLNREMSTRSKFFTVSQNGLNAVVEMKAENVDKFNREVESIKNIITANFLNKWYSRNEAQPKSNELKEK